GQHGPDYDLISLGADNLEGGEEYDADIESWRVQ
ncbi:MAG: type II secretion system protein GspG, partial [bacterium]|nr:type II secretion system protein GspG [bacterium]